MIWEKKTFKPRAEDPFELREFHSKCREHLMDMANSHNVHPGQFLICDLKPIGFESRGSQMSIEDAKKAIKAGEQEEMIRVFESPDSDEPTDIVALRYSILNQIGSHVYRTYRLYFVCANESDESKVDLLKKSVREW